MPVDFSTKASDTYDSLYYLAEFVVVSRHLACDSTRRNSTLSPHRSHSHHQPYPEAFSTTVRGISIRFPGSYWARRQLHTSIRHVPTRSILMELQASDLLNSMAGSSTTVTGIPILIAGGFWARRQLHAGIRYIPVASKPRISLASVEGALVVPWRNSARWLIAPQPL